MKMDLIKMHPMARKLEQAQKGFLTALEGDNAEVAKQHLTEVQKLADFLADDLNTLIAKSETAQGINDIYAGGVPVMKFTEGRGRTGSIQGQRLPGSITTGIRKSNFSRSAGTFGRYSN